MSDPQAIKRRLGTDADQRQHTRKALEALHPNIGVFRHPDHTPTGYDLASEFGGILDHLTNFNLAKASTSAVEAIYGTADGMVLFWAHHEKLLVVDRKLGFMGGLDMCESSTCSQHDFDSGN